MLFNDYIEGIVTESVVCQQKNTAMGKSKGLL